MKIKVLIAAAALIFVIGIACSIFVLCSPSKSIVNIVRDGEVLYSFDLSKEENRSFVIKYGDSSNTVEIKDGTYEDAADSDIVVVTLGLARKPGQTRLDLAQTNVNIIKEVMPQIARVAPDAIYVVNICIVQYLKEFATF